MKVATSARAVSRSIGAIEPDDSAKRRERICLPCVDVRIGEGVAGRNPARIGVLDHDGRRFGELERNARGGVEIQQVRKRQFLPLMDLGRGETMTGRTRPRRWRLAGVRRTRRQADEDSRRSADRAA